VQKRSFPWRAFQGIYILVFGSLPIFAIPPAPTNLPEFEAVSIRPAATFHTVEMAGTSARLPAPWKPCEYLRNRVTCRMPLYGFLREAFQVREFEIKAPQWTKEDMFDLQATMPLDTPKETARLMLQNALKERFGLEYHLARRITPVYALVPTQDGPKLTEPDPEHPQTRTYDTPGGPVKTNQILSAGRYFSASTPLDVFAQNLRSVAHLDRPVINETGLAGKYVIDMKWKSSADPEEVLYVVDTGILRATEQQLGLKVVKKDALRDYLSIDQAKRTPSEN
jgi:uncharacterized protein (TIGR03435 family)